MDPCTAIEPDNSGYRTNATNCQDQFPCRNEREPASIPCQAATSDRCRFPDTKHAMPGSPRFRLSRHTWRACVLKLHVFTSPSCAAGKSDAVAAGEGDSGSERPNLSATDPTLRHLFSAANVSVHHGFSCQKGNIKPHAPPGRASGSVHGSRWDLSNQLRYGGLQMLNPAKFHPESFKLIRHNLVPG